jgi:propanediol dehydratase small subunit
MNGLIIALLSVGAVSYAIVLLAIAMVERRRLRKYWSRVCTGTLWRERFPEASKTEIRDFLNHFVSTFGFRRKQRFQFAPDDQIVEVYRSLYPAVTWWPQADCMELEQLAMALKKCYDVDLVSKWRDDLTLGDVFALAKVEKPKVRL